MIGISAEKVSVSSTRQNAWRPSFVEYRHLGRSGLRISAFSLGSWITYGNQLDPRAVRECMAAARDAGVNFFDNAEVYAAGRSEELMGRALHQLGWSRDEYVVSSKFYWGLRNDPNSTHTLNRKYLLSAIDGSLSRFGLEYLDLIFCHRPDPTTPIEEVVWSMHDIIGRGKALYWGTSEWAAADILAAWAIAEKHHLRKPVMEQPEYNLFHRTRVEVEYAPLYNEIGLGLTTWSPLASGLLTGKYLHKVPQGSRVEVKGYEWLRQQVTNAQLNNTVAKIGRLASDMGYTTSQLALAWCLTNPNVSSVITGASRVEQITENMKAVELVPKLNDDILKQITGLTEG